MESTRRVGPHEVRPIESRPRQLPTWWSFASLFGSVGTLLCCALPSLLVLLGMGATVGSLLSTLPWLVTLSRHKQWTFALSGGLIAASLVYTYWLAPRLKARPLACSPDDPAACP